MYFFWYLFCNNSLAFKASPSAVSMSAGRRRSPWHARAIMLRAHCRATIHPHRRGQLYYI